MKTKKGWPLVSLFLHFLLTDGFNLPSLIRVEVLQLSQKGGGLRHLGAFLLQVSLFLGHLRQLDLWNWREAPL